MIDEHIEVPRRKRDVDYGKLAFTSDAIAAGAHRKAVGALWDEMGELQAGFLTEQGLAPGHRLLDIGCGSLRAGRLLVDHLDPGDYYGVDVSRATIEAGYNHELTDAQRARLPEGNLRVTDRFDVDFGVTFDVAIAQSVFTHLSLNFVRLCLHRTARVMAPGGRLFATFFEAPPGAAVDEVRNNKYNERNVYWYYRRDMRWAAVGAPLAFDYLGAWGHPRNQRMVCYTRT